MQFEPACMCACLHESVPKCARLGWWGALCMCVFTGVYENACESVLEVCERMLRECENVSLRMVV